MGVVLNDGDSLDNAARISDDGDLGNILISADGVGSSPSILNRATGRIVNNTDIAIYVDGAVGSFINRGEVSGFNNAVVIGGDVGSFLNESLITSVDFDAVVLNGMTGDFTNSGRIEGFHGIAAFEIGMVTNAAGASIIGNGSICGFPCGLALGASTIGTLNNAGMISGMGTAIEAGTIGTLINTGTIKNDPLGDVTINLDAFTSFYNSGTIMGPDFDDAIFISNATDSATFINRGTITAGEDALDVFSLGTFENHGTMIGGESGFLSAGHVKSFFNAGTLEGQGTGGFGIGAVVSSADLFVNTGRILGMDIGAVVGADPGFSPTSGVSTTIVNSGLIGTDDPCGCTLIGLVMVNGTLRNSGTIRGGFGVLVVPDGTTGVVVTNSGAMEGMIDIPGGPFTSYKAALLFDSIDPTDPVANNAGDLRDDTLFLLPGSRILGAVDYANGVDTLDLRQYQGNQALLNYNLEQLLTGPSVTGQSTSGNMTFVVTVDDTALRTAVATQFNSFTKGVFSSIRGASGGNPVGTEGAPLAYAPSLATPAGEAASDLAGGDDDTNAGKVWVGSFGDLAHDDTAMHAFSQQLGGVVLGAHAALDKSTRLGIVVSGGSSLYATDLQTQTIRGTLGALGLYGDTDLGMMTADFALLGGAGTNHSERNLTGIFGNETAVADYTGWFVSPAVGVGMPLFALDAIDAKADVRVRYLGGQTGAYTETGSSMNLSVPAQAVSLAEARAGFTATAEIDVLTLTATIGALVQSNLGGTTTSFALAGPTGSIPLTSTTPGTTSTGLYGGASLDLALGANARVTASAGAEIRTDGFRSVGGSVNLGGTF